MLSYYSPAGATLLLFNDAVLSCPLIVFDTYFLSINISFHNLTLLKLRVGIRNNKVRLVLLILS
jgi:hypothetical protein